MTSKVTTYNGFILTASAFRIARGYANQVCLTRHNGPDTKEMILTPQLPERPFESEEDALDAALEFGKAAIEGRVPSVDVTKLY